MSWRNIPRKENFLPLFAEDWNAVVDALDDLYYMLHQWGRSGFDFTIYPKIGAYFDLGKPSLVWRNLWVQYIYTNSIFTNLIKGLEGRFKNLYVEELVKAKRGEFDELYLGGVPVQQVVGGGVGAVDHELKVMLNEIMVREITETKQKFIKVIEPSGARELCKPKDGYALVIKDWYLITNSTTGEITLVPLESLNPIAWLPADIIKQTMNQNMWLKLYQDEPLWVYWYNLIPYSKILATVNFYELYMGLVTKPPRFDPYDPCWMPSDGWTKLWDFDDPSEIDDFANIGSLYAYVEDSILKFNEPYGEVGYAVRVTTTDNFDRVAIAFRLPERVPQTDILTAFTIARQDGSKGMVIYVIISNNDPTKIFLLDMVSSTVVAIPYNGEWRLLLIDFVNKVARIYDQNHNVLGEITLTEESTTEVNYEIDVYDYNYYQVDTTNYGRLQNFVDWIAFHSP